MTITQAKRLRPGDRVNVWTNAGTVTANGPACLRGQLDDGRGFMVFFDEHGAARMLSGYHLENRLALQVSRY